MSAGAPGARLLPWRVPSRRGASQPWSVSRIVWQSWIDRDVPERMHRAASSWIELNPELEYRFFDDDRLAAFVRGFDCSDLSIDRRELVAAFEKVHPPAAKADLFRYLALYREGGVWADIDAVCRRPVAEIVDPGVDLVVGFGPLNDLEAFVQFVLIARPGHPFLRATLERAVRNILAERFDRGLRHVFALTGPVTMTCAINELVVGAADFEGHEPGVYPWVGTTVRVVGRDEFKRWFWQPYAGYAEDRAARGLRKTYYLPIFETPPERGS